eukprot:gnl/Chilomastix_cuspidata/5446.p1 GENE.gnl/Chilomastix_cuspidata/5446~~gnl/Chilomastix_cuspidata/5446.p1  ORF type:complete len:591 (+),score=201.01 gnl/Chilomastix_cuspidata/5446:511-2283(+)
MHPDTLNPRQLAGAIKGLEEKNTISIRELVSFAIVFLFYSVSLEQILKTSDKDTNIKLSSPPEKKKGVVLVHPSSSSYEHDGETNHEFDRVKKYTPLFFHIAHLQPLTALSPKDTSLAQQAAAALGVSFVPTLPCQPLPENGVQRARAHACRSVEKAEKRFRAELHLLTQHITQTLRKRPVVSKLVAAHERVVEQRLPQLGWLTRVARTVPVPKALLAACAWARVSEAAEAAEWAAREAKFNNRTYQILNRLAKLHERYTRLDVVRRLEHAPSSEDDRLLVWMTLHELYGTANRIEDFEAFAGASALPCVKQALASELVVFNGLRVSEAAPEAPGPTREGMTFFGTSLSKDGVMCAIGSAGSEFRVLFLLHIPSGRAVELCAPHALWACAFSGRLFIGTEYSSVVRHASLATVFAGLSLEAFGEIPVPGQIFSAAVDRAADGWIVFRVKPGNSLVRLDLRTCALGRIECDRRLASIGSLTGIRIPDVLCAGWEFMAAWAALLIRGDGSTEDVATDLNHPVMILPSAARPSHIGDAAVLDYAAQVFYRGRTGRLSHKIEPMVSSLARLFQDVFICYSCATGHWHVLRIVVP